MAYISGSSVIISNRSPQLSIVSDVITLANASTGDVVTYDYKAAGMWKVLFVEGTCHTTTNSVMVDEPPTTVLSGTTLSITVGGSAANNYVRSYRITGMC